MAWAGDGHIDVPPGKGAGSLIIGSSPQLELAAFAAALLSDKAPSTDTPARDAAYENAGPLSLSPDVKAIRDLEPLGLSREALLRFALLQSPPPSLAPRLKVNPEELPATEATLHRDHRAELKRLADSLRALYREGDLEAVFKRHGRILGSVARVYQGAFPDDFPASRLQALSGDARPAGSIYLVPSLLAETPMRVTLPLEGAGAPLRFSVLPVGEEGVPDPAAAALIRYEEVARWVLEPLLTRFRTELAEVSGADVPLEPQLIRALYLHDQSTRDPAAARAARASSSTRFPLLSPLEELVAGLDAAPLSRALPRLLDDLARRQEGARPLPQLTDPGFERWTGAVPEFWSTEVVEPATGRPRPSIISRVRGEKPGSWALMLSGDRQTNEWQGVMSEPLAVIAGDRVRVSGRMKAEQVTPLERRVTAAHLEVRAVNRDGTVLRRIAGRDFAGTTGWETISLEFIVPAGADRLQVGCILAMVGQLSFDDLKVTVERPTARRFIDGGGFESSAGNAPEGWETLVAVRQTQSGPTVASRWDLDRQDPPEGRASLHLAGDDGTSQWLEIRSGAVVVAPGQRVSLTAWMSSRGVTLGPRQHRHANLTLTFLNERGIEVQTVESEALEGTHPWQPVALDVVAPLEAVSMRVGCLLTMTGDLWIDDVHLARR